LVAYQPPFRVRFLVIAKGDRKRESANWQTALQMKRGWRSVFWRSGAQYLAGGIGLALVTFVCFRFGLKLSTTSLQGSLIGSIVLSIIAVGLLNYFFAPALFSLPLAYPVDILTAAAFLTTSVTITSLTARLQRSAWHRRFSIIISLNHLLHLRYPQS
jgi:hypothetical protein